MQTFNLRTSMQPRGDQPQAIDRLSASIRAGNRCQTLLGVTGSGKTFTMASVIARVNKPTLVISPNKTLAAQLYAEFKELFPDNAVEFFISYYDYYQPEAYIPQTDTYIEKDSSINERINRLRLSATTSLMTRRDVIVVASVSCIYNLGSPAEYRGMFIHLRRGATLGRDELLTRLLAIRYERNDVDFNAGTFRVRGDTVEIFPAYEQRAVRVEFFGDQIERISMIDPLTARRGEEPAETAIYPAKHFLADAEQLEPALARIEAELNAQADFFEGQGKWLEAQRLRSRTRADMEMLREIGYCHGIENYSLHLAGRPAGSRPYCLIDYFPPDFLTIIDESHVTVPQIHGMFNGDRARKEVLRDFGFRLPSCLDNRPLRFSEFEQIIPHVLFASATPGGYELARSAVIAEQLIRPTGLLDPEIFVVPTQNQVDDLIARVRECAAKKQRVLVTTLTKRMAEDLARYLQDAGLAANYLHSELDAIERVKVLGQLRRKQFDCLVGVNLLREGLDLPEVALVCILDADREGFLRSATSLIQVAGRAARHIDGRVVMYADACTESMRRTIEETNRRRGRQQAYNAAHGITPRSIEKAIKDWLDVESSAATFIQEVISEDLAAYERRQLLDELETEMIRAAKNLQFERAIVLRDKLSRLKEGRDHGASRSRAAQKK
ncbi:MAG: excinuclease ABC subunit UvrB [Candidatus Omnitrophica bacterium]|nr:excinuclease ABC subunit UvrB [Candidatus Omnitrophota bacterium]